jgi:hypothetical protein
MSQDSGQSSSEAGSKGPSHNNIKTAGDGTKYYSDGYEPPSSRLEGKITSVRQSDGNIYTGKFSGDTSQWRHEGKHYQFMYDDGGVEWYQLHKTVKDDIIAFDTVGGVKRFFFGPKSVEDFPELTSHPTTTSGQNTQQIKSVFNTMVSTQRPQGTDKILPDYSRESSVTESVGGGTRKRKTRKRKKTQKKRKKTQKKRRKKKKKKRRKKKKTRRKK